MIVREIHIDGFGVHHDLRHELTRGLNLIVGPNEAGKTTLHAFVRGMLYGFPDGRSKESSHPPLRGGNHGGRLTLETEEGLFRIIRRGTGRRDLVVEVPGGGSGGQEILDSLLRKTDGQLFRNVFAFGIDELADFGGLTGPEMELRIFDTAVSGAGRSVSTLVAELQKIQQEELSARKGRIRILAHRIEQLGRELKEAKARVSGYAGLAADEAESQVALGEARGRAADARSAAAQWEALLSLWPQEQRRQQAESILVELSSPGPDAGAAAASIGRDRITRFDALHERLDALDLEEEQRGLEGERLGRELVALASSEPVEHISERVAALARDQRLQADRRERLPLLRLSIGKREEAASALLASLGAGWSEALVREVDRAIVRREELDSFAARFRDLEREEEAARRTLEGAEEERERASQQLAETKAVSDEHGSPAEPAALDRRGGALAELRAARDERGQLERRLQGIRDQRLGERRAPQAAAPAALAPLALWAGAGIFAVGAVAAFFALGAAAAGIAGLAALVLLALALVLRSGAGAQDDLGERQGDAVGDLQAAAAEVQALILEGDEAIRRHAQEAGLEGEVSAASVEAAAEALQRARNHRHRWEDLQRELQSRNQQHLRATTQLAVAGEAQRALEEKAAALHVEWSRWLEEVFGSIAREGLLGAPGAAAVRERLVRIDELIALFDASSREEAELRRLDDSIRSWNEEVAQTAALAGIEGHGEEALARLLDALEQEQQKSVERRMLGASLDKLEEARKLAGKEREKLEATREQLLEEAGARDRDELIAKIEEGEKRDLALVELRNAERAIEERLGLGDDAEALRLELASGEKARWEAALEEARRGAEEGEREVEELAKKVALLGKEREELERSAAVPRIAGELAQTREELEDAVRRWRAAALLEKLLKSSLDDLRRERQPAVLRAAGEAFATITGGRYTAILQSLEGDGVEVLDTKDRRIPAAALSRGTREQLYICVRLGLVAAFAEQGTRLPLLMDDVLVNFDPARADAAARVLADHAADHQLLLFTCHPQTIERFGALVPDAPILELGRLAA